MQPVWDDAVHTSFRKSNDTSHAIAEKVAGTAHARKYGYSFRKRECPNRSGNRSVGPDRKPPMIGLDTQRETEVNQYW